MHAPVERSPTLMDNTRLQAKPHAAGA